MFFTCHLFMDGTIFELPHSSKLDNWRDHYWNWYINHYHWNWRYYSFITGRG